MKTRISLIAAAVFSVSHAVAGEPPPLFLGGPVPAEYRWTGLYVGTSLGLASVPFASDPSALRANAVPSLPVLSLPGSALRVAPPFLATGDAPRQSLPALSVQMGYNRQLTPGSGVVVGIEADLTGLAPTSR